MFQNFASFSSNSIRGLALATVALTGTVWAQPDPPSTPDLPCSPIPTDEEVPSTTKDNQGFVSIFDGTPKGWWHSCLTGHSNGSPLGAIFKITQVGNEPAIYSNDRDNNIGGILMTKKKYTHYELVFDFWPDFENDGGVFNRTTAQGQCAQTVLDYFPGASVGGWWSEAGFQPHKDIRPWKYTSAEQIESNVAPWTTLTQRNEPTSYGCAASGCVAADYTRLWDKDGWNQIRIKFFGGSKVGEGPINMQTWFRKAGSTVWVPILSETAEKVVPPNYIGFQVHNGNRFKGPKGSWYKNIKIRELRADGTPPPDFVARKAPEARFGFELSTDANALRGSVEADYEITVKDLNGKKVEAFSGRAGKFSHAFKSDASGWLLVQVKTAKGVENTRVLRVRD